MKKAPFTQSYKRAFNGEGAKWRKNYYISRIRALECYLNDMIDAYGFITWVEVLKHLEDYGIKDDKIYKHLNYGWNKENPIDFHLGEKRLSIEWTLEPYILEEESE